MGNGVRKDMQCQQLGVRFQFFKVAFTAGTPALTEGNYDATINDDGVGTFTLTFNEPGQRAAHFIGGGVEDDTDAYHVTLAEATATTSMKFVVYTDAGAAADPDGGIVHLTVVHFDATSQS